MPDRPVRNSVTIFELILGYVSKPKHTGKLVSTKMIQKMQKDENIMTGHDLETYQEKKE